MGYNARRHQDDAKSAPAPTSYFFSPRIALKTQNESEIAYHELAICRALPDHSGFVKLVQWTKDKSNEEMTLILEKGECTVHEMFVTHYKNKVPIEILKGVLFQVLYTLWYGQRTCEFMHNDLHLKNVLLKKVEEQCVFTTSTIYTGGIQRKDVLEGRYAKRRSAKLEAPDTRKIRRSPLAEMNNAPNTASANPVKRSPHISRSLADKENSPSAQKIKIHKSNKIAPQWFGSCWRTDIGYMAKLADFGSSRITLLDGTVLCIPPHSEVFNPNYDLDKLATEFKRIQPDKDTPQEERKLYLSLKKQMGDIGSNVEDLLDHPFFNSLRFDPETNDEECESQDESTHQTACSTTKATLHFGLNPMTPIVFRNKKRVHPESPAVRKRIRRKTRAAAWAE